MAVEEMPRSRLLDFIDDVEDTGLNGTGAPGRAIDRVQGPQATDEGDGPRSRLLDLVGTESLGQLAPDGRPGPKPGVPAYHTPVVIPAHPCSVAAVGEDGHRARVPFVVYELFARPDGGTAAFAFTSPSRLAAELGPAQPWIASSIGPFAELMAEREVTVLLDPRLPPGTQNWQPEDLAAYAQEVR